VPVKKFVTEKVNSDLSAMIRCPENIIFKNLGFFKVVAPCAEFL
jgi:hypothetical protein